MSGLEGHFAIQYRCFASYFNEQNVQRVDNRALAHPAHLKYR